MVFQFLVEAVTVVAVIGMGVDFVGRLFSWELSEKICGILLAGHQLKGCPFTKKFNVSALNQYAFGVAAFIVPMYFYSARGGYLVRFNLIERDQTLEMIIPIIMLLVGICFLYFFFASLWHSAYVFGDKVLFIPLNPFKSFVAPKSAIGITEGVSTSNGGINMYQIQNGETGKWYHCLLVDFEKEGFEVRRKAL